MNCKKGDLAIVIRSRSGNEGKIVRCVRLLSSPEFDVDGIRFDQTTIALGPRWEIDPPLPLPNHPTGVLFSCSDACLRPIRGDLLDKETEREKELVK